MTHTVVHFLDSDTFGGCEEVVLTLLEGLVSTVWQPVLLHHDEPGISRLLDRASQLGIPCRIVPRITSWSNTKKVWQFLRVLSSVEPTVFHAHLNWPLGCRHGLLAAWLSRIPVIVATSHLYAPITGVQFGWIKQYLQATAIDRYIAVSSEVGNRLCHDLHISELKIRVVHNGIRQSLFEQSSDATIRDMLTNGSEYPIVFTPARLHSQKGHEFLLGAAALVPNAIFVLAGEGPERESLEMRAHELGIEDRVRFLGSRQDIPQLLANCDLFVLPSLYEGLPISVLEAMAAGKPIIATDIGGTNEAIIHNETGFLVPPANADELAQAIKLLLSNRALALRLAEAGKEKVEMMFSSKAMVEGVTNVYEDVLSYKDR